MNYQQLSDGQLLGHSARGNEAAFAALYARYGGRLFAYCYARCGQDGDTAEDLRQQVFLQLLESKAFAAARRGQVREELAPLLFSIAANLLKNNYRQNERRERREATFRQLSALYADQSVAGIDPQQLRAALKRLPAEQRACLELRFQRGLSTQETAEALQLPSGTVKSRLHYGLKKLAEVLRPLLIE